MAKIVHPVAYFDCPTGIAGDMCLGALIHLGLPLSYLQEKLGKLGIKHEYSLTVESVQRNQQAGTKVHVRLQTDANAEEDFGDQLHHHHKDSEHRQLQHDQPQPEPHNPKQARNHARRHNHHHDYDHGHNHSHSHAHPHSHDHPHSHGLGQTHSSGQVHHGEGHRNLQDIQKLIQQADLPPQATAWSLAVFQNLAIAEGAVHGMDPNEVHFHEVGAVDAIVDIVGTCLGLDYLGIEQIYCSPLPTGGGTVWAAHGRLPVPAPAVLKLFAQGQVPIYSNGIERELVTPTGAAIAVTLAKSFGPPPPMRLHQIGLGAGSIDLPLPNLLRVWVGELDHPSQDSGRFSVPSKQHQQPLRSQESQILSQEPELQQQESLAQESLTAEEAPDDRNAPNPSDPTPKTIAMLQTQLDDISPQAIGYTFDRLLEAGALDVFTQAIAMKKNRPGTLLTLLCPEAKIPDCEAILFRETSTLGIRRQLQQRTILRRHWETVTTPYGPVRIKIATGANESAQAPTNVQPEYEDCAAIARQQQRPWREIHQLALQAWQNSQAAASP